MATLGERIDVNAGRNAFTTPPFVNLDTRFAKRFTITSGVKAQLLIEFFNLFNRQNPAAVGRRQDVPLEPFGVATQVLPDERGRSVSGSSSNRLALGEAVKASANSERVSS
jgi:hypothetical protein